MAATAARRGGGPLIDADGTVHAIIIEAAGGSSAAGDGASASSSSQAAIEQFFNRLLGLPLHCQRALFDLFASNLEAAVQRAKAAGEYDAGTYVT